MNRGWQQRLTTRLSEHSDAMAAAVVSVGFMWRLWLAHATFFSTDEAWHYFIANQNSVAAAYKASLTLYHPPLLILIVYFWRILGTSDLVLRLPVVIAGTAFCYVFYKWLATTLGRSAAWVGLVLVTFLPPLIALSADLRQYTLMLVFSMSATYFLERAVAENSARMMTVSSLCLYLAMLSHYSAFLFAAALAAYFLPRMVIGKLSPRLVVAWGLGQVGGIVLAWFLYAMHISKLGTAATHSLYHIADWYLHDWYFEPSRDQVLPFLYHATFGVFRFIFGQTTVGSVATLMFVAAVALLFAERTFTQDQAGQAGLMGTFLLLPFLLNSTAALAGVYPYGRTRQCVFLAVFAIAGVSWLLARIAQRRAGRAVAFAIMIVVLCHVFGTLQGRDMLPLAEQRHEHLDHALNFIRREVAPTDLIFTDRATSFQLGHYLCQQRPITLDYLSNFESFQCQGLRIVSAGPNASPFTPTSFPSQWQAMVHDYHLTSLGRVWVVQAGWAGELASVLDNLPPSCRKDQHSFGRYVRVFRMGVEQPRTATQPAQVSAKEDRLVRPQKNGVDPPYQDHR